MFHKNTKFYLQGSISPYLVVITTKSKHLIFLIYATKSNVVELGKAETWVMGKALQSKSKNSYPDVHIS
jgi:hypothetical protein